MTAWRRDFHANITEVDTPPGYFYNADQSGLYYHKLPNFVYVE